MTDETEALRAEVAELRAEVERLKIAQNSHACPPNPIHHQWFNNTAGAAGYHPAITRISGDQPLTVRYDTTTCAAAAAPVLNFFPDTAGAG
jgi:hypothetical protein